MTQYVVHPSIARDAVKMLFYLLAIPIGCLALVGWVAAARVFPRPAAWAARPAAIALACLLLALLRTDGITGYGLFQLHWRWTPTAEQRLLAGSEGRLDVPNDSTPTETAGASLWPGFRGVHRDSVVQGAARIAIDWSQSKPVELWRRPVGPGWSSFAASSYRLFTQEQRGDDEVVACYHLTTGRPLWAHKDLARFWESTAGAGPRGTPSYHEGRVYSLGATGIVNALRASDGHLLWSNNAAADTGVKVPEWGFAGSPLVVDDLVVIATGGRLAAYDRATGERRWVGPPGVGGYSSPHLATLAGVRQVLLFKGAGVVSVAPATGDLLWKHTWKGDGIVQPAVTSEGDVLLGAGSGLNPESGVIRLAIAHGPEGWTVAERWVSKGLKPYYNDFVLHRGHAYGFDGGLLACIDLSDGQRRWKGGRYGHGQVVVLPEQDLLLVLSETGEVALVQASPDKHRVLAKFKAIEGKTWNHPALVGDVLLVRNGEEMAALRLPHADR